MTAATVAALFFTVALLVTMAYFLMGSVPLLILKHDTPVDARFIRGFFNTYYLAAMVAAAATSVSYGFSGRLGFAIGAAAIALLAVVLRKKIMATMDLLRPQIQAGDENAIQRFRRIHLTAILINLTQLILVVWSLTTLSL